MAYDQDYYLSVRHEADYMARRAAIEQARRDKKTIKKYREQGLQYFKDDLRRNINPVLPLLSEEETKEWQRWINLTPAERYRERHRHTRRQAEHQALSRYGLSLEEVQEIKSRGCEACGTHEAKLCIDHDHDTGEVRGCLCDACNKALGALGDDITRVRLLLQYMEMFEDPVEKELSDLKMALYKIGD